MQDLRNEYTGIGREADGRTARAWEAEELKPAEPRSSLGSRARRLREEASQTLRSAGRSVGVAYDRTADRAVRAYHGARGYAQSNPGVAAATTFAAGLGVGVMLGGRSAARAHRRSIVPVVAIALAQAVRDVLLRAR